MPRAYRIAGRFQSCGIPVVLGGVHVSLRPREAAAYADAIVTGFAEEAWPGLLRDVAAGKLKPCCHGGQTDLRGLPRPRRAYQEAFRLSSIMRRLSATPHFAIAFVGNLAYRRYVRRLQAERECAAFPESMIKPDVVEQVS